MGSDKGKVQGEGSYRTVLYIHIYIYIDIYIYIYIYIMPHN